MGVEICVDIIGETEMAFKVNDGDDDFWIPKSQIENLDQYNLPSKGDNVVFEIPEWLAQEKGLI